MRLFLAGIMQGSHREAVLHDQCYRRQIKELLREHLEGVEIYDPLEDHATSLDYDDEQGRRVFLHHIELCRQVDVVLAFIPEASMGTAIEIWAAKRSDRIVVTISDMTHNWVVKFLSDVRYRDVAELEQALRSGELTKRLAELRAQRRSS